MSKDASPIGKDEAKATVFIHTTGELGRVRSKSRTGKVPASATVRCEDIEIIVRCHSFAVTENVADVGHRTFSIMVVDSGATLPERVSRPYILLGRYVEGTGFIPNFDAIPAKVLADLLTGGGNR